ncbi:MAG TPA: YciI family protein [Pseudolabrys sp.]|nr:YciI family protein [Pseudolabrys sp.]
MPTISTDMPHFFLKLVAPRPTFANDMNDQEKAMMQEHFLYWKGRQDRGEVLVFGPVLDPDGPYGMGIINVTDEAEARAFSAADPAIRANIGFTCEIHPMRAVTREQTN